MDASTLRWILIVIGLVVVGSIFLFGNPSKKKAPKASPRRAKTRSDGSATRREPTLDSAQPGAADDLFADVEEGGQGELAIDDEPAPEPVAEESWYAFWSPFRSEWSAQGFARRLRSATRVPVEVVAAGSGQYRVAFSYQDETERLAHIERIETITGLRLE